tara:strand:- start:238 stop:642 length:405 start_codon:yes stop_codon:yes gene_type:complete
MASQVLTGTGDVTYTNNTGQNVRIVINYMRIDNDSSQNFGSITVSFGGVSTNVRTYGGAVGRGIAGTVRDTGSGATASQNYAQDLTKQSHQSEAVPLEIILAPTETFSVVGNANSGVANITLGAHNIVVIPEAG